MMEGVGVSRLIEKRRPCTVCCRFFARDRDLILSNGYYICESQIGEMLGGDSSCDFAFPADLPEEAISKAVEQRICVLKKLQEPH